MEEAHPLSKSLLEQELHKHLVIETQGVGHWREQARYLREEKGIYASVATASSRNSYVSGVAYLFCPSAKKPKEDLDQDPLFSPGHDPLPNDLQARREGSRRIPPAELYETITRHQLDTVLKLFAFAARQYGQKDKSWITLCMKLQEKKAKEAYSPTRLGSGIPIFLH